MAITRGDSGVFIVSFKEKCKPFNLNGYDVTFIVKKKGTPDDTAIITISETIDTDISELGFNLTSDNTTQEVGSYDWAIRIENEDNVQTVAEGIFDIVQGVFE